VLSGGDPKETGYAKTVKPGLVGVHGNPMAFARLANGMKRHGWMGGPISGWINRRGEIVVHDGMHRSTSALAAGIFKIPVSIYARDEDWIAFRHAVKKLNGGHKLYQPIFHPDFDCWPCWRKDTRLRIDLMLLFLKVNDVSGVCDLGCHSGTVANELSRRLDLAVWGIDQNYLAVDVACKASHMTDIGSRAVFSVGSLPVQTDAVVCLSAINHALVKDIPKALELVKKIRACGRFLITDCPSPGDPVGGDSAWADPDVFSSFIAGAGYRQVERWDRSDKLQRTMFVFERV
jgi:hypothetical protein